MKLDWRTIRRAYVQYRYYIVPTTITTVVAVLTMVVLIPGIKQTLEMRQGLQDGQARLAKLSNKILTLQRLDAGELVNRTRVTNAALPSQKDVGAFLLGIRGAALKSGVEVTNVDLSPGNLESNQGSQGAIAKVQQSADTGILPIEVTVNADLPSLLAFLKSFQDVLPTMSVTGLSFSRSGVAFQVKLKLGASYWPAPTSLGAVDMPVAVVTAEEESLYQRLVTVAGISSTEIPEASESGQVVPVGNPNIMAE